MNSRQPVNPFTPGAGLMPPVLAGREAEKSMLKERLNRLCHPDGPHAPKHVLISGPRGVGKTVLLRWAETEFKQTFENGTVIRTKADSIKTLTQLVRVLDEQVIEDEIRHAWKANPGPVGGGKTPQLPEVDIPWGHLLEKSLLQKYTLSRTADADSVQPLLITVDEAHTLSAEVAVTLANLAQEMADAKAQVWFLLAGTPNLLDHLSTVGPIDPETGKHASATFVERNDKLYPGTLAKDVARQALIEPLHKHGVQIDDSVLDEALDDAQGYPWFIQLWGEALWENRQNTPRPNKQLVAAAREKVDNERTRIYQARYDELNEPLSSGVNGRQVLTAAAALANYYLAHDNAPIAHSELTGLLDSLDDAGISVNDHKALKRRFLDTGFIVENPVGRKMVCSIGIPSLANFISEAMPPKQPEIDEPSLPKP